ncbi:MAG: peptidylprolyl isomerase [Pyrinomonadaceae bacterium]|nr:peptidylprolyl isomerase [Pyrinomonadaceae bacterium]
MIFKNILKITTFVLFIAMFISCNKTASKTAEVKKGVKPIPDNEVAIVEMEQPVYGKFTIELYSNVAPEMVKRFKDLAKEGVYNGTIFHRVNTAVVQGGDPLSKDDDPSNDGTGKSNKPDVPAEFSDIQYDTGIVGAARSMDVNSQNSQFFITLKRTPEFDGKYTIFGKVIDGMSNIRTIAGAPRDGERPMESIKIKSITIQTKQ